MASNKKPSAARLKTILLRQSDPTWDSEYLPSILATPQEAPSISRASILTSELVYGREIHLLSPAERSLCLLGLYHPDTLGLQEQRMLSLDARIHPLASFPGMNAVDLPPLKGILNVAERLGYLQLLPLVNVPRNEDPTIVDKLPFPFCGDLLWAIKGGARAVYAIDWNIKDTCKAFKLPAPRQDGKPRGDTESPAAMARHEMQRVYYADAGIRSIQVAGEGLDPHVAANLRQLFLHHRRRVDLSADFKAEILDRFRSALETETPPLEILTLYAGCGTATLHQCRDVFYQAVWNRQLRLNLFQPVLIDGPMQPEKRDILEIYADWFRESRS